MVVKSDRIPALNPIRFIKANDTKETNINTWGPDRGFFYEHKRYWQYGSDYTIKRNYTDLLTMYIDTLAVEVIVHLYDTNGEEIPTAGIGFTGVTVPGNVYTLAGTDYPYQSINLSFPLSGLYTMTDSQKIIFIALECVYDTGAGETSNWYISEPVFFRNGEWRKTMLITATNSTNDYDVMFEATNAIFHYRVEADILDDPAPAFKDTVFEDQQYEMTKLQSVPYDLFDFVTGAVPKYMLDKINRAFACDTFTIDGITYVKDGGANWSMTNAEGYKMHAGKIRLQKAQHESGTSWDSIEDPEITERVHTGEHSLVYA